MKTDKERLLELLNDFNISPLVGDSSSAAALDWSQSSVTLYAYEGNVVGYNGFHCRFEFDKDGKFIQVGVWE